MKKNHSKTGRAVAVGCSALLGRIFHHVSSAFRSKLNSHILIGDLSLEDGYVCASNPPLFGKHLTIILRLTLRFLRHLANLFEWCGFASLKKITENFSLNLFSYFLLRFHPGFPDHKINGALMRSNESSSGTDAELDTERKNDNEKS